MEYESFLICSICFFIILIFLLNKKKPNLPPGPWNLPIVGSLPWLDPTAPHVSLTKLSRKFGPILGLYLGGIYTVVISDVKLMKKIFTKDAASGRTLVYLVEVLTNNGKGVVMAQDDLWKDQRKFVHNLLKSLGVTKFTTNRKQFEVGVMRSVLEFIKYVEGKGDCVVINPTEVLGHNLGSVSSWMIFGKTWSRDDAAWNNMMLHLHEVVRLLGVTGPLNFLPFLRFLPKYKKDLQLVKATLESFGNAFKDFIEKREHSREHRTNLVAAFQAEQSKEKRFYTDDQLRILVHDIFGASVESTVNSLTWYLLYMAIYQQAQDKVRAELLNVLQGQQPGLDHLVLLPYLEASIAEVTRIRTMFPLAVPHAATEDIEFAKYIIPKGAMLIPLLWAVHMDPTIWGDPENYRPERFLDEEGKFVKSEHLIPFHTGKRMCVGEDLAKMVMFLFAAHIIQNFRIECEDGKKVDLNGVYGITLAPPPNNLIFVKV